MKDVYPVGEHPPPGHLPDRMYAWAVRRDRHGEPRIALREEVVSTPRPGPGEAVVMVMAAGIGLPAVWACLGIPSTPFENGARPYRVPGADCAGVVWALGPGVSGWREGDEVIVYPVGQGDGAAESTPAGGAGAPLPSCRRHAFGVTRERGWGEGVGLLGYQTADGALAQFTRVRADQLVPKPASLTWEQAGCHLLALATAWRLLTGHAPHVAEPGRRILVWGAAGPVGAMAVQVGRALGAHVVGVASTDERLEAVARLGADGVIDRRRWPGPGPLPDVDDFALTALWQHRLGPLAAAVQEACGGEPDIVVDPVGAATFPISCRLARSGGMVVFCGGATGYTLTFDARFAWMREIRVQGSHFAHPAEAAAASRLVGLGRVDPCMSDVFRWGEIPAAHTGMLHDRLRPGNRAALVQAARPGCRSL